MVTGASFNVTAAKTDMADKRSQIYFGLKEKLWEDIIV